MIYAREDYQRKSGRLPKNANLSLEVFTLHSSLHDSDFICPFNSTLGGKGLVSKRKIFTNVASLHDDELPKKNLWISLCSDGTETYSHFLHVFSCSSSVNHHLIHFPRRNLQVLIDLAMILVENRKSSRLFQRAEFRGQRRERKRFFSICFDFHISLMKSRYTPAVYRTACEVARDATAFCEISLSFNWIFEPENFFSLKRDGKNQPLHQQQLSYADQTEQDWEREREKNNKRENKNISWRRGYMLLSNDFCRIIFLLWKSSAAVQWLFDVDLNG